MTQLAVSVGDALLVGGGLVVALAIAAAPFTLAREHRPGPAAGVFVGEREGERLERQEHEVEDADSVAGPAIERGAGGPQGTQAPSGGMPT
jgi:hypothetical protein